MSSKEMPIPPKEQDSFAPDHPVEDKNPRFMDASVYTVIVKNDEILQINSHTQEETVPSSISKEAKRILKAKKESCIYIGNIIWERYSYRYEKNDRIIITDNQKTNQELQQSMLISLFLFVLFESLAYGISHLIASWIIKPVEITFKKQKQFIADASHELKTPLAVIMASADALENDKNKKWLKNIQSESERMNQLIKDLLDLAKLENEEVIILQEKQDISKLVEKAVVPFESLAFEKNIKLDYEIQEKIEWLCNASEIKQLIAILMDNAIKHSIENGQITVTVKKEKEELKIEVINEGEPIPKEEEGKIFERFYRIDKARNRKENRYGLGLAIAKNIVLRHKGEIKAHSKDGKTTFKVKLKK